MRFPGVQRVMSAESVTIPSSLEWAWRKAGRMERKGAA